MGDACSIHVIQGCFYKNEKIKNSSRIGAFIACTLYRMEITPIFMLESFDENNISINKSLTYMAVFNG